MIGASLTLILLFSPAASGQNDWGLGIRFGDPSGLTLKKYMGDRALELSIGRTHWFYDDDWYDRRFDDWYEAQRFRYRDLRYVGHEKSVPIGLQLHYLFHKDIAGTGRGGASGLDWYYGFGGQIRFQGYRYDYRYRREGNPDWYYETSSRIVDFDLGGDVVIGLEYTFANAPISLFMDATLFMEIIDDPFLFWFQGGIGGRFNF